MHLVAIGGSSSVSDRNRPARIGFESDDQMVYVSAAARLQREAHDRPLLQATRRDG
jgi:hypothetical protein